MEAAALAFCWTVLGEKQEAWFKKKTTREWLVHYKEHNDVCRAWGKNIVRDKCMCVYVYF